jgi:hypothetical protein
MMENAFKRFRYKTETILMWRKSEGPEGVPTLATGRIIATFHIEGKTEEVIALLKTCNT